MKKYIACISKITLTVIFLILPICCKKEANKNENTQKTIVVLGSSTAAAPKGWVYKLDSAINDVYNIINLAKGGISTYEVMPDNSRFPGRPTPDPSLNITHAISLNPKIIIINLPSNDISRGYSEAEFLNNLDSLYRMGTRKGIKVYITTTQPRKLSREQIIFQKEAKNKILTTYGKKAIDFWDGLATDDGTINSVYDSGDETHFNLVGHQILFQRVDSTLLSPLL